MLRLASFLKKYAWLPVLFFGVLAVLFILFPPRWGFWLATGLYPGAVYYANTSASAIALTIDDGPSDSTAEILNILRKYRTQGTFFLLSDRVLEHRDTVVRLAAEQELGNHLTADEASIRLSADAFKQKFLLADAILSRYGPVRWLRPGMGWYSPRMVKTVQAHSYTLALGSVFPYDTHIHWVGFAVWFILNNVQPGDIIILHDGPERGKRTAAVLAQVLPVLQQRGYAVVTLSELFAIARSHHSTSQ